MKKYELTDESKVVENRQVYRIRYIRDLPNAGIKNGMLGGFVENEENLSHEDDCVVLNEAVVCGDAKVLDYAQVSDNALIAEKSVVKNQAVVSGTSVVRNSHVYMNARIEGESNIEEDSRIFGNAKLMDVGTKNKVRIFDYAVVLKCVFEGMIDVKGQANVQYSRIKGMHIDIMDTVFVKEVKMKDAQSVTLAGSANLYYCDFDFCRRIKVQGQAKMHGNKRKSRLSITGSAMIISGDAIIEGSSLFVGDNISITHSASVLGYVRVGDNVNLSEMAVVENKELHEMFICDTELSMDTHLIQEEE